MSEKTIFPDWNKKTDELPEILDYNKEKNIFAYAGEQAWVCSFSIPDLSASSVLSWAVAPDNAVHDYHNDNIATPEECEARKKEIINSGMNFINSDLGEEKVKHFPNGKSELNPWIHGNEPEHTGEYEITIEEDTLKKGSMEILKRKYVRRCFYDEYTNQWENQYAKNILAYKPILFSPPYVPEGCEALKKENRFVTGSGAKPPEGVVTMGTVMHADDPTDKILNNGWIPGDKPEKEGWYEIIVGSIPTNPIEIDYYSFVLKKWRECNDWKINAYKPITLSTPYVPPEPKRELLCPFCNAKFQSIELACDDYYFQCCVCRGSLPPKETKQEARQFLFEIYDKLNPLP